MGAKANYAQQVKRLEKKISKLNDKLRELNEEAVQQRIVITRLIKIFLTNEHLISEEQRIKFRETACEWASKVDDLRGASYCYGEIDFQDGLHLA